MEKQLIISVGREYGSGGHEIAERLSKHYGIQLLDHNLLDEIAADKNLDMQDLRAEMDTASVWHSADCRSWICQCWDTSPCTQVMTGW